MADLSAVLRKTIDGLPRSNPQMRAKVYEKARAAIARQIETANPQLAEDVVEARRSALDDAIARTEAHYTAADAEAASAAGPSSAADDAERPSAEPVQAAPRASPSPDLRPPAREVAPPAKAAPPPWVKAAPTPERADPPLVPAGIEPRDAPDPIEAPFLVGNETPRGRRAASPLEPPRIAATEPAAGLDEAAIPAADLTAPRQGLGARRAKARSRTPVFAGLGVLLFAGAAAASYVYLDEIRSTLGISGASTVAGTTTAPATPGKPVAAPPAAPSGDDAPNASPSGTEPAAAPETEVAAIPGTDTAASAPAANGKRRFTQRLLPDGTEVDEGPGPSIANAFEEGTNLAEASPPAPVTPAPIPAAPATAEAPAAPPAAAEPAAAPIETAAAPPGAPESATTPAVAQKAVFYEERSETDAGTQRGGNVVWSVVQEPPAEGQPAEAAIRAVADVPEESLKLTLTIRRNTDATLPASHVIELMFETPPNFPGGSIANVQRLALKPTEQARGEPLIGVAGKISDGFFIIALNNLSEATNTNLDLLNKEQWIDIPIAYATGRRALMSIEKGIPGDRAFKEAMDAWSAGKT